MVKYHLRTSNLIYNNAQWSVNSKTGAVKATVKAREFWHTDRSIGLDRATCEITVELCPRNGCNSHFKADRVCKCVEVPMCVTRMVTRARSFWG